MERSEIAFRLEGRWTAKELESFLGVIVAVYHTFLTIDRLRRVLPEYKEGVVQLQASLGSILTFRTDPIALDPDEELVVSGVEVLSPGDVMVNINLEGLGDPIRAVKEFVEWFHQRDAAKTTAEVEAAMKLLELAEREAAFLRDVGFSEEFIRQAAMERLLPILPRVRELMSLKEQGKLLPPRN